MCKNSLHLPEKCSKIAKICQNTFLQTSQRNIWKYQHFLTQMVNSYVFQLLIVVPLVLHGCHFPSPKVSVLSLYHLLLNQFKYFHPILLRFPPPCNTFLLFSLFFFVNFHMLAQSQ